MAYKKTYDKDFTILDNLLKTDTTNSDFVLVPAEFNRLCVDASISIVLARIFYWWRVGSTGTKLRRTVDATGELCIAKSRVAMSLETGITEGAVRVAYKKLNDSGIVTLYTKERENGHPTTKIVLNEKVLVEKFWIAYKEIQLEKAYYYLKLYQKKIHKVRFYSERIIALQSPTFDPVKDFTRVESDNKYDPNIDVFDEVEAPSTNDKKVVNIKDKMTRKKPVLAEKQEVKSNSVIGDRTLEEFITDKKKTLKSASNTDESQLQEKPPIKRTKIDYSSTGYSR